MKEGSSSPRCFQEGTLGARGERPLQPGSPQANPSLSAHQKGQCQAWVWRLGTGPDSSLGDVGPSQALLGGEQLPLRPHCGLQGREGSMEGRGAGILS